MALKEVELLVEMTHHQDLHPDKFPDVPPSHPRGTVRSKDSTLTRPQPLPPVEEHSEDQSTTSPTTPHEKGTLSPRNDFTQSPAGERNGRQTTTSSPTRPETDPLHLGNPLCQPPAMKHNTTTSLVNPPEPKTNDLPEVTQTSLPGPSNTREATDPTNSESPESSPNHAEKCFQCTHLGLRCSLTSKRHTSLSPRSAHKRVAGEPTPTRRSCTRCVRSGEEFCIMVNKTQRTGDEDGVVARGDTEPEPVEMYEAGVEVTTYYADSIPREQVLEKVAALQQEKWERRRFALPMPSRDTLLRWKLRRAMAMRG
ncbi:hypothetical protein BP5796_08526 [Coleophoma crateriformis]|uniref:Uncharacterized protein n=1 Tax=Coleophoma crateriformis TaxID=565419 RepID=A0A3D8R7W2_9HELO|nr:hypothetical protein BP5796_08526 [Coleophoma crateriformis]